MLNAKRPRPGLPNGVAKILVELRGVEPLTS